MKLPVDPQFREERARYALRLHCEDCALFDPAHQTCVHGYPTDDHRRPTGDDDDMGVVFCKDFEVV